MTVEAIELSVEMWKNKLEELKTGKMRVEAIVKVYLSRDVEEGVRRCVRSIKEKLKELEKQKS